MRLKNIIWKTVVMSLMASPLCISCDDDDEVTMNSKFYLSTKVFPVDSYEASLSVILKDNSVVVNDNLIIGLLHVPRRDYRKM